MSAKKGALFASRFTASLGKVPTPQESAVFSSSTSEEHRHYSDLTRELVKIARDNGIAVDLNFARTVNGVINRTHICSDPMNNHSDNTSHVLYSLPFTYLDSLTDEQANQSKIRRFLGGYGEPNTPLGLLGDACEREDVALIGSLYERGGEVILRDDLYWPTDPR